MEPDGPGLLFDDAVALFGREVAVDFPWVSPSRLLPKSGLAGGDVFPMVAFATSWWYYSLGNSSWRAMVTALPHQRWVALERSAPGRTVDPSPSSSDGGWLQRDPAVWDPERLNACFCLEQGPPPFSVHHHTCTTATALSAVPSRGCQSELDGRPQASRCIQQSKRPAAQAVYRNTASCRPLFCCISCAAQSMT